MKNKIMSIAIGAINGGLLSVAPVLLYNYILKQNFDMPGGTEVALGGAFGAIFLITILNIIMQAIIYASRDRTTKSNVFTYVFAAWFIATLMLAFTFGWNSLFSKGVYGENINAAFGVLCSIINFITMIVAAIIAKFLIKIVKK